MDVVWDGFHDLVLFIFKGKVEDEVAESPEDEAQRPRPGPVTANAAVVKERHGVVVAHLEVQLLLQCPEHVDREAPVVPESLERQPAHLIGKIGCLDEVRVWDYGHVQAPSTQGVLVGEDVAVGSSPVGVVLVRPETAEQDLWQPVGLMVEVVAEGGCRVVCHLCYGCHARVPSEGARSKYLLRVAQSLRQEHEPCAPVEHAQVNLLLANPDRPLQHLDRRLQPVSGSPDEHGPGPLPVWEWLLPCFEDGVLRHRDDPSGRHVGPGHEDRARRPTRRLPRRPGGVRAHRDARVGEVPQQRRLARMGEVQDQGELALVPQPGGQDHVRRQARQFRPERLRPQDNGERQNEQ